MHIIEYWKEASTIIGLIIAYLSGRKSQEIKIKREGAELATVVQGVYKKMIDDVTARVEQVENSNKDLSKKYDEMLLKNALLEEKAENYEERYLILEKDYGKLKLDHDKLYKENKEIRKELDELKNNS